MKNSYPFKKRFFSSISVFISIYIGLFITDTYLVANKLDIHKTFKIKKNYENLKNKDFSLMEEAKKSNFKANFLPNKLKSTGDKFQIYPIGTLPNENIYYCNEGYGLIKYKSDRFGLRNNDLIWENQNITSNNLNFFIGDSFTQGACVDDQNTIPNLYNKISEFPSINLGHADNGPYEYINLLRSIVKPILDLNKNKVYVNLIFYPNDEELKDLNSEYLLSRNYQIINFDNFSYSSEIKVSDSYKNNIQRIINDYSIKSKDINTYKRTYNFLNRLKLVGLRKYLGYPAYIIKKIIFTNFAETPTAYAIDELKKICNKNCIPTVVFIPMPDFPRIIYGSKLYNKNIKDYTDKLGIRFLDLTYVLNTKNFNSDYPPRGEYQAEGTFHLSKSGYKKVSEYLYKFLIETNF